MIRRFGRGLPPRQPELFRISRRSLLRTTGAATSALAGLGGGSIAALASEPRQTLERPDSPFRLILGTSGIVGLEAISPRIPGNFLRRGACLGALSGMVRTADGYDSSFATSPGGADWAVDAAGRLEHRTTLECGLEIVSTFELAAGELRWTIAVSNVGKEALRMRDLALTLPINHIDAAERTDSDAVLKHSFVGGRTAHLFWQRRDGLKPWLALLPVAGTPLEFWDEGEARNSYRVFIHAEHTVERARAAGSRWRMPATGEDFRAGDTREYRFRFQLVDGYAAMRQAIAGAGMVDVEVLPSMTVPTDLPALLSLGSDVAIAQLVPEYPEETRIIPRGERAGRSLFEVRFQRTGENHLTLVQVDGGRTTLEFFVTEPVEILIAKRAAFVASHQHTDPDKWYRGLLAEWNMETGVLLGPDNYDRIEGWRIYAVSCDDPGLSKPAMLATKNAEYPVQQEIDALDDYIEHFVWGGLQRTADETFPYAIYGAPDWKQNRGSADPGPGGQQHFWRAYDYPHIIVMYLAMFRVARNHPNVRTRLPASDYLERAAGTAIAMYTIPAQIANWEAYYTGYYNELVVPDLIDWLERERRPAEAARIRAFWERKVRHFVEGGQDLFQSEYAFDSTGFESTQALSRYALDRPDLFPAGAARAFADQQMAANLFCRGWLQPAYYLLGSDYRQHGGDRYTLSYMAQMGGWAVLDYALNDSDDPYPLLRLGSASILSSWALVNSGTAESGYGYWFPGAANDGGAGGGFEPGAIGTTWLGPPHRHGSWYYSCEIDLGFCGALRGAATILADDPLFGIVAMGGTLRQSRRRILVTPRDGVRRRFYVRLATGTLDVLLGDGLRFAKGQEIAVAQDLTRCSLSLEFASGPARSAEFRIGSDGGGRWAVRSSGGEIRSIGEGTFRIDLDPGAAGAKIWLVSVA